MRIKPGAGPVILPKSSEPAAAAVEAPPTFKPGAESATGWGAALTALEDGTKAGLAQLVKAAGITQALQSLKEALHPPGGAITALAAHVEAMTTLQRAELITTIQKSDLGSAGAAAAAQVLLATQGRELTTLKNLVDGGGDLNNLEALVFETLKPAQRDEVLAHFAREAVPTGENKVFSDIDDTVYASVNDPRFDKGTRYPGVRAFMDALDQGPKGDVMFMTARPRVEAGGTFDTLKKMGFEPPTLMTGGLVTYLRRVLVPLGKEEWAYPGMGARKVESFERHQQLFPEYGYTFVGDNGQGDVHAARGMLASKPERMKGAFIHLVAPEPKPVDGVSYFHTYVGAAAQALKQGAITKEGAAQVAAAVLKEVETTPFKTPEAKQQYLAELSADVKSLDELLDQSAARP